MAHIQYLALVVPSALEGLLKSLDWVINDIESVPVWSLNCLWFISFTPTQPYVSVCFDILSTAQNVYVKKTTWTEKAVFFTFSLWGHHRHDHKGQGETLGGRVTSVWRAVLNFCWDHELGYNSVNIYWLFLKIREWSLL